LWDVAQMAIFGDFLGPAFAASRVQHLSDLQPAAAEIRRGKKERYKKIEEDRRT